MARILPDIVLAFSVCASLSACSQADGNNNAEAVVIQPTSSTDPAGLRTTETEGGSPHQRVETSGVLREGRLLVLGDSYSLARPFRKALEKELPGVDIVFDSVGGSSLADQLGRLRQRADTIGWPLLILDGGLTDHQPMPEIRSIVALQNARCDLWFYVEAVKRGYPNERVQNRRHRQIDGIIEDLDAEFPGHTIVWNEALKAKAEGTQEDKFDIADGIMPGSLRQDAVHLNAKGYGYLAEIIADNILQAKGDESC